MQGSGLEGGELCSKRLVWKAQAPALHSMGRSVVWPRPEEVGAEREEAVLVS